MLMSRDAQGMVASLKSENTELKRQLEEAQLYIKKLQEKLKASSLESAVVGASSTPPQAQPVSSKAPSPAPSKVSPSSSPVSYVVYPNTQSVEPKDLQVKTEVTLNLWVLGNKDAGDVILSNLPKCQSQSKSANKNINLVEVEIPMGDICLGLRICYFPNSWILSDCKNLIDNMPNSNDVSPHPDAVIIATGRQTSPKIFMLCADVDLYKSNGWKFVVAEKDRDVNVAELFATQQNMPYCKISDEVVGDLGDLKHLLLIAMIEGLQDKHGQGVKSQAKFAAMPDSLVKVQLLLAYRINRILATDDSVTMSWLNKNAQTETASATEKLTLGQKKARLLMPLLVAIKNAIAGKKYGDVETLQKLQAKFGVAIANDIFSENRNSLGWFAQKLLPQTVADTVMAKPGGMQNLLECKRIIDGLLVALTQAKSDSNSKTPVLH